MLLINLLPHGDQEIWTPTYLRLYEKMGKKKEKEKEKPPKKNKENKKRTK